MAHAEKSAFYQALKSAGYEFDKHYRDYSTDELRGLAGQLDLTVQAPPPRDVMPSHDAEMAELKEQLAHLANTVGALAGMITPEQRRAEQPAPPPAPEKVARTEEREHALDPAVHAGSTLNSVGVDEVIKTDEYGNEWFQIEVPKSGSARPRARRVLRYMDPGSVKTKVKVGEYEEGFEVAGDPTLARPAEIKITLPSYQTGIYRSPKLPFKIHTYQGARGFDMDEVQRFYGASDLVPSTIKRVYVGTDLCFDIATTIRAIETEYRERVLEAKKGL